MERLIVREFASSNAGLISSDQFVASSCQALLNILASAFLSMLKHDMCQGVSTHDSTVADVVDNAFSVTDQDIERCFSNVGDNREVKSLMECLYYVAGWHAQSIKKASIRRREGLRELMCNVYNNIVVGKGEAAKMGMPIQKVERVELFGGLKYVCHAYFLFVLRLEYVFMTMFTTEKLVMIGGDLITNVYIELSSNRNVRGSICSFCCDCFDGVDDDTMDDFVAHLTKTYCRMRGKDFVRKYMQHGFKNKNLGKGICPTLAIISNPEVRKALGVSKKEVLSIDTPSDNLEDEDKDMHAMMELTCRLLVDDKFVDEDKTNLFQESNV